MRLKELRTKKKLTQSELGKILKISPSTIGMYEQKRREPDLKTVNKIADYFNVSTDYLLGRSNCKNQKIEREYTEEVNNIYNEHFSDLTDEQMEKVLEYINFLKSQKQKQEKL